jgi:hypothetical protein
MDDQQIWLPLVDERIGALVARIQEEDAEIAALVASPRRQLAFVTFANIRVGLLLGQLLVDTEIAPTGSSTWIDDILAEPANHDAVTAEVKAVAREIAADPELAEEEPDPRPEALRRFRDFARKSLGE